MSTTTPAAALDRTQSVAEIVLGNPECAAVFRSFRIDFCCKGDLTVAQACEARALNSEEVFAALENAVRARRESATMQLDVRDMSTAELITHVIDRHHAYLRRHLPWIGQMATKVARVHGGHNPVLIELARTYHELAERLAPHLDEEEQRLFPAMMASGKASRELLAQLAAMRDEHELIDAKLDRLRELADDFAPPPWACNTYRTLFAELANFEADVYRHMHIENHLLARRFET